MRLHSPTTTLHHGEEERVMDHSALGFSPRQSRCNAFISLYNLNVGGKWQHLLDSLEPTLCRSQFHGTALLVHLLDAPSGFCLRDRVLSGFGQGVHHGLA